MVEANDKRQDLEVCLTIEAHGRGDVHVGDGMY